MSRGDDPGRQAREALQRALVGADTSVDRLVESVPSLLAAAERARRQPVPQPIVLVARAWLPRLALAALGLVAAAWLWPARTAPASDESAALDAWIVTGQTESEVTDPVMDALVHGGDRQ